MPASVFMPLEESFCANTDIGILCGNFKVWSMKKEAVFGEFPPYS